MPRAFVRRRKWILFSADNGVSVVMYRPIAAALRADPRLRQFHAMHFKRSRRVDQELREDARTFFGGLGIEEGVIHYKLARNLPCDVYVTPNFNDRLHAVRARRRVQIFHGVSFKNYCIKEKALRYDRLFLPGAYHKRRYVESGLFRADDPRLVVIGLPKLDRLARGEIDRAAVLRSRGLDPSRPTVLYAPTGDAGNSLFRHGEEILRAFERLPVNLIVKPHDHADPDPACRIDWPARLASIRRPGFAVDLGFDVVPLLAAADLLLTDASSVAFEYALLDRPIIFFDVPEILNGPTAHMFDLDTWGRKGGDVVHTVGELADAVPALLAEPSAKSAIRRRIAADLFHEPGTATERAVRQLYREVGLSPREALSGAPAAADTSR